MNKMARWGWWACGLLTAGAAHAACSRAIEVPMAPIGLSVSFDGGRIEGVYPALLRELGAAAGCEFRMQHVPRARLQKMFESGQADLLIPASTSPSRQDDGEFVPLIQARTTLLTVTRDKPPPRSLAELIARPDYKLAVVRGFSFGAAYDQAVATLRERRRLVEESDANGVARALREGMAHGTVMAASIFVGTLVKTPDLAPLLRQVHSDALEELGWGESGVYLSRRSLDEADRRTLHQAFTQVAKAGRVWQLFNDIYPTGALAGSIRPQ